jgi:hypothetical protein
VCICSCPNGFKSTQYFDSSIGAPADRHYRPRRLGANRPDPLPSSRLSLAGFMLPSQRKLPRSHRYYQRWRVLASRDVYSPRAADSALAPGARTRHARRGPRPRPPLPKRSEMWLFCSPSDKRPHLIQPTTAPTARVAVAPGHGHVAADLVHTTRAGMHVTVDDSSSNSLSGGGLWVGDHHDKHIPKQQQASHQCRPTAAWPRHTHLPAAAPLRRHAGSRPGDPGSSFPRWSCAYPGA